MTDTSTHASELAALMANAQTDQSTGCTLWQGKMRNGTPTTTFRGEVWGVPRLVWILSGRPIQKKQHVYRRCRTWACITPEHLSLRAVAMPTKEAPSSVPRAQPIDWRRLAAETTRTRVRKAMAHIHVTSPVLVSLGLDFGYSEARAFALDHDWRRRAERRRNGRPSKKESRLHVRPPKGATDDEIVELLLQTLQRAIEAVGLDDVVHVRRRTEAEYRRVRRVFETATISTMDLRHVSERSLDEMLGV